MLHATASVLPATTDAPAVCAVRLYAPGPVARHPFHIAFLLDVSGSMEGGRISAVKQTLHDVLELLTPSDRISLVPYSSSAQMLWNAWPVTPDSVDSIRASVAALQADGGTNLEAGLVELRKLAMPPDALVLLTDGHCNMGARHASQLLHIAYTILPETLPIHTIGYGTDHNHRLLADLATTSHGSYGFVETDAHIPVIMGDIVGSLATRVAHTVCVECGGGNGWTASEMQVGDMIADRAHWVVFRGKDAGTDAGKDAGTGVEGPPALRVSWSPIDATPAVGSQTLTCDITADISPVEIAEQRDRVHVTTELNTVVHELFLGTTEAAKHRLGALRSYLETSIAVGRPLHTQLLAQVSEYIASLEDPSETLDNSTPLLPRMLSRNTTLTVQRGTASIDPAENMFSSPVQRHAARTLLDSFTQSMTPCDDDAAVAAVTLSDVLAEIAEIDTE
jgi:hypothetical protein